MPKGDISLIIARAHRMALSGPSKVASTPSPVVLISDLGGRRSDAQRGVESCRNGIVR
jgi:hypothetical protein